MATQPGFGYDVRVKRQQFISLSLILLVAAIASFAVSCKPASDTTQSESTINKQIDKAQSAANEATSDLNTYTYAQKTEFVAAMEKQLADLNRSLDELGIDIAKANPAIKAEAEPKVAALRARADLLTKQLDTVKNATSSTWDTVKAATSTAYDELSTSFNQAREWLSEKIAP